MNQSVIGRKWVDMPDMLSPGYKSTAVRSPGRAPVKVQVWDQSLENGPIWPKLTLAEADLTTNGRVNGDPIGERIIVEGTVSDGDGRPVAGALVELWQANAAGRYIHREELHPAPLDTNFIGAGRAISDPDGTYRFITIKPGSYPWGNHRNAWRPAHLHFSVFGAGLGQRLVTQMYFPGDQTLPYDPIFNSVPEAKVRNRLIARFDMEGGVPNWAHCFRFDIVLGGAHATPFEEGHDHG